VRVSNPPRAGRGPEPLVEELIAALREFTVESDVFVEVFAGAHGLGRSDLNAIMWISDGSGRGSRMTIGQLAGKLGLGRPAATALIDRLEASGHVRRARDSRDRRKVTLEVEPRALALAVAFFQPLGILMHGAVSDVPATHLTHTLSVVRRMTDAVVRARAGTTPTPDIDAHRPSSPDLD